MSKCCMAGRCSSKFDVVQGGQGSDEMDGKSHKINAGGKNDLVFQPVNCLHDLHTPPKS